MTWFIPAKTFLVGEYVAINGGPAIILTTQPSFELRPTSESGLHGIHPDSPAGRWFHAQPLSHIGLQWHDPYAGRGGLGASSAQFLSVYHAVHEGYEKPYTMTDLIQDYQAVSWRGHGLKPSGYDVLAQSAYGCVYLNQRAIRARPFTWCFSDLAFILVHTQQKLATHHHLESIALPDQLHTLENLVSDAHHAFQTQNSAQLVDAVNAYHQNLLGMRLVAKHTQHMMEQLQGHSSILAMKGCGAMGSDLLCVLVASNDLSLVCHHIEQTFGMIIATSTDLATQAIDRMNEKTF